MSTPDFRPEVLAARYGTQQGSPILSQPRWAWFAAIMALGCVALVIALAFFASFDRKVRVGGVTAPQAGYLRPTAPAAGVVTIRHVVEGATVAKGDPLITLNIDRQTGAGATGTAIASTLSERRASISREMALLEDLSGQQRRALSARADGITNELNQLQAEARSQEERVALAKTTLNRFVTLQAQGFVPELQVQQRQAELLDVQARLNNLARSRAALERDRTGVLAELAQQPAKTASLRAVLERQLSELTQDITEVESRREVVITAPADGRVAGEVAQVGENVQAGQVIARLIAVSASLEAHLKAPSSALGFVESGQSVQLRLHAFPYQKFGMVSGRIERISRVPDPASEPSAERFLIVVALDKSVVEANGVTRSLQPGMQLDADIQVESRRIIDWVLDPLYRVKARV